MTEHNLTRADLIANDSKEFKAHHGGKSTVRIEKIAGSPKRVTREAFVERLAAAMCIFFDCKSYSSDFGIYIDWTFFGIASNTIAAAMAFEMVHNLILDWACHYKGGPSAFSYQIGVADGLRRMANHEKQNERQDAPKIKITTAQTPKCEEESGGMKKKLMSSVSNLISAWRMINPTIDVDDLFRRYLEREKAKPLDLNKPSNSSIGLDSDAKLRAKLAAPMASIWESHMQLTRFRATSEQVAADYLAQQNIQLHCGRRRNTTIRDRLSYFQDHQDSSKINVRQKSLTWKPLRISSHFLSPLGEPEPTEVRLEFTTPPIGESSPSIPESLQGRRGAFASLSVKRTKPLLGLRLITLERVDKFETSRMVFCWLTRSDTAVLDAMHAGLFLLRIQIEEENWISLHEVTLPIYSFLQPTFPLCLDRGPLATIPL